MKGADHWPAGLPAPTSQAQLRAQRGGGLTRLRLWCPFSSVMAPLKVPRLTAPLRPEWGWSGSCTPSPGRDRGVGGHLPSAAWGFVQGGPRAGWEAGDNGGCGWAGGWHSGLAVKQNKPTGTFLYLRLRK